MKEGFKTTTTSTSTTTNSTNINNNNNNNEKESNDGIHEFTDSQFELICKETRLWEKLKIVRDLSKRGETVQQCCILAIELKVIEEKKCGYAEEAKLEVKAQAAQNVDMNKLDEDERQLRITEENASDDLIALKGTDNNLGALVEFVEILTNLVMTTEYAEHERVGFS